MKRIYCLILSLALIFCICNSSAAGGSELDPVVTKSYIDSVFLPDIIRTAEKNTDIKFNNIIDRFTQKISDRLEPAGISALMLKKSGYKLEYGTDSDYYEAPSKMIIGAGLGTFFTPISGNFYVYLTNKGALIDITDGNECYDDQVLINGHTYISASESGTAIRAAEASTVNINGGFFSIGFGELSSTTAADDIYSGSDIKYKKYADSLYKLGLFSGTDIGYELDREATRAESIVMLLRLLGELPTAQDYPVRYNFTDVQPWASHYISYAYAMNYTAGMTNKTFGSSKKVTAAQYLTFVLRSLGYSDVGGDFVWDKSGNFAVQIGLITEKENKTFSSHFYRDEMVLVSYRALNACLKGSSVKLIDKLIALDIVDESTARRVL